MPTVAELLADYPAEVVVSPQEVRASRSGAPVLVVLDDDPTGTQSVADLPVLTRWEEEDFGWAFRHRWQGRPAPAVYVLTNTRSLGPEQAAHRTRECVRSARAAARAAGVSIEFVSRSDSTLRGHYPLEPDMIAATLQEDGRRTDGVVIVPAFPDAGRITLGGVHYVRAGEAGLRPVAETEFAQDVTFGYGCSDLAGYVEEKSQGRIHRSQVIVLDLTVVRGGTDAVAGALEAATDGTPIVVDAVTEDDLRALALGLHEARRRGRALLYRVGPPFVRAMIGQAQRAPLTAAEIDEGSISVTGGGLVVVGSHVALTTRQLQVLVDGHKGVRTIELSVEQLLEEEPAGAHVEETVAAVVAGLADGDVVLHTSRLLVRSPDPQESLRIARLVSAAVVTVVRRTLEQSPPRFVVAKGGITSSDVAAHGMGIRRAVVRGSMLPGLVSLWQAVDGPAHGLPFVVFAGNVGDDRSLLQVVDTLSGHATV